MSLLASAASDPLPMAQPTSAAAKCRGVVDAVTDHEEPSVALAHGGQGGELVRRAQGAAGR